MHAIGRGAWLVCSRDSWYVLERYAAWTTDVTLWSAAWPAARPDEGGWVLLKPRMLDRLLPHVPFSEFWTDDELETRLTLQGHGVDLFQTVLKRSTFSMSDIPVSRDPDAFYSAGFSCWPYALRDAIRRPAGMVACKVVHFFWATKRRALQRDLHWLAALAAHESRLCMPGDDPETPMSSVLGNRELVRIIVGFAICKESWQQARERGHL